MIMTNKLISTAVAVTVSCLVGAGAYYYRRRKYEINEVMVFCKLQFNVFNYFDKLIGFIETAKESVNICMPGIHNPAIQGRLVELIKDKHIKIRILIDQSGYNEWSAAFVDELREAGAEIQWKCSSQYKMQHKFCLVDDDVLMTGTLNWGNDLSADNWNYVLITSKPQLVSPIKKEFYELWNSCDEGLLS